MTLKLHFICHFTKNDVFCKGFLEKIQVNAFFFYLFTLTRQILIGKCYSLCIARKFYQNYSELFVFDNQKLKDKKYGSKIEMKQKLK